MCINGYYLNRETRRMKPVARLIKLISSTGAGKTELTKYFAAKIARPIIGRCIGRTNSTITPRIIVFTEDDNVMQVATKKKKSFIEVTWFDQQMVAILTEFVQQYGTKKKIDDVEIRDNVKSIVTKYLNPKSNVSAVITLISKDELRNSIDNITTIFCERILINNLALKINAFAEANIDSRDQKYNPERFKKLIRNEVEKAFESIIDKDVQELLRNVWNELNQILDKNYRSYFMINSYDSIDGYNVKEFKLENLTEEDNKFIDRLFDNNDVSKGKKVSIETLCEEIVIYVPMNEVLLSEFIKVENIALRETFLDSHGKISFAITDTMGLFHKGTSDEENDMYLGELVHNGKCDAIVFLAPLAGDTNGIKLKNAYERVIANFSLDIPIIVINNKADVFLDQERKNQEDVDIDDLDVVEDTNEFDINNVIDIIDNEIAALNTKLVKVQHKKRSGEDIHSYGVYFKLSKNTEEEFVKKYHPKDMAIGIMRNISEHVGTASDKLTFYLDSKYTDISFEFNEDILRKIFVNYLGREEWYNKVYNPVQDDIKKNIPVTPHGQSYYKLKRNISVGNGSVSQIDESRFKNVSSFAINFPGNIKNLMTTQLIFEVIDKALIIENGNFEDLTKAKERIYEAILDKKHGYSRSCFRQEDFTAKLLYERALLPAEQKGMTFGSKFQGFLEIVDAYVKEVDVNVEQYEGAFKESFIEPLYLVANRNVRYVRP
ncbi:hypothetical protein [uncultured Clostridium sp.]|uniref:hypothetical protein n=1 Tax=uncultured Clostridium sp. TaxID=59620 RepID=UPI0032177C0D